MLNPVYHQDGTVSICPSDFPDRGFHRFPSPGRFGRLMPPFQVVSAARKTLIALGQDDTLEGWPIRPQVAGSSERRQRRVVGRDDHESGRLGRGEAAHFAERPAVAERGFEPGKSGRGGSGRVVHRSSLASLSLPRWMRVNECPNGSRVSGWRNWPHPGYVGRDESRRGPQADRHGST